jgi:hypothetical protein
VSKSSIGSLLKRLKTKPTEAPAPITAIVDGISQGEADMFMEQIDIQPKPAPTPKVTQKAAKAVTALFKAPRQKKEAPVENPANKANLIARITLNANTFEPILLEVLRPDKDSYLANLGKMSETQLQVALKTLEHTRSVYNISTQLRSFVYMGAQAMEYGTQRFLKMKTEGFAQALQLQDQDIRLCLAEYCMDKVDTFQKVNRPEAKLASILVLTLMSVDAKNRMAPQAQASVAPGVVEEYKDL